MTYTEEVTVDDEGFRTTNKYRDGKHVATHVTWVSAEAYRQWRRGEFDKEYAALRARYADIEVS